MQSFIGEVRSPFLWESFTAREQETLRVFLPVVENWIAFAMELLRLGDSTPFVDEELLFNTYHLDREEHFSKTYGMQNIPGKILDAAAEKAVLMLLMCSISLNSFLAILISHYKSQNRQQQTNKEDRSF